MKRLAVVVNADEDGLPPNAQIFKSAGDWLVNLLQAVGHDIAQLPAGELLSRYHGLSGRWMVMSPVHWQATHNDAMIESFGTDLNLSVEESKNLFAKAGDFLSSEGFKLHWHNAFTWLLETSGKPDIHADSLYSLQNRSFMPALSALDSGMYWQRLLTELQMLLNAESVVNGVWIHGGGEVKLPPSRLVLTDDEQLKSCFPDNIRMFSGINNLKNNSILALQKPSKTVREGLQFSEIQWFWNNTAYVIPKKSWWKRIISCG